MHHPPSRTEHPSLDHPQWCNVSTRVLLCFCVNPQGLQGSHLNLIEKKEIPTGRDGRTARRHHTGILSQLLTDQRAARCGIFLSIRSVNINNACSQHACRALIHDRSQCPTPLRAGLLGPRVVSPHAQGLQGSHLNLSQTSAHHRTYFLLITSRTCERRLTMLRQST